MLEVRRCRLGEAVTAEVTDGTMIYIGNFGAQLFAVGHELIRQGRRDLHIVSSSGGILTDQLLGAGTISEATFSHCWSPIGPAPAWNYRRLMEAGDPDVVVHELTLATFNAALTAGAWNVPFMPTVDVTSTGHVADDWSAGMFATVTSPFGSAPVVRALTPDVAFIHADACDPIGNVMLRGPRGEMTQAAQASRRVVVVAEEIVGEVPAHLVAVPGAIVDLIVVEPFAVHPDGAVDRYGRDSRAYVDYSNASRTVDGFEAWLDQWVRGVADRDGYRRLLQKET